MSNIIRLNSFYEIEKRVIKTKKIINKKLKFIDQDIDLGQQKKFLTTEISQLEEKLEKLQITIREEQEQVKKDIELWWLEKKQVVEKEAVELKEHSKVQGFQAGYDSGLAQAAEESREKREYMQELIEQAYEEKNKIIQRSEHFLLSMSVRIAEKIVKKELKQHDDQLLNIVQLALKHLEESEDVVMQVALEDYPILLPFFDELKTYIRGDSELKLIPVANLSKGGCMIHTASGSYDVTVSGQLEEIKRQLLAYSEEQTNNEPTHR